MYPRAVDACEEQLRGTELVLGDLADVVAPGKLGIGQGAPKQSELKQAPLRSSNRPMVPGLSKSGGRNAVSVRSPTSSVWPGLSRYSRSIGMGAPSRGLPR